MKRYQSAAAITCGVIGYGGAFNMGKAHLNEMKKAGMTPAAVCEIDPERLKAATQEFPGIETYSSVADMLKKSKVSR
jgi:predicted dehydrogenase